MTQVERLGSNFVNEDGDVLPMADWRDDEMEPRVYPSTINPEITAQRALRRNTEGPRPGAEPSSGRDIARDIDIAQSKAEEELGRDLTDEERAVIARQVERESRGL